MDPITNLFYNKWKGPSLRNSHILVMAGEAVIPGNTQGTLSLAQPSPALFLAMREGMLSNLELTWKSVISKPRIKLETFGICISFGSGKDEFEAAADFVIFFPGES